MTKESKTIITSKSHLPVMGVGPIYVGSVVLLTVLAIFADRTIIHSSRFMPSSLTILTIILGLILITLGLIIYILALKIKITKSIIQKTLVTHGVYSVVRNPIYSAWLFICTGSLFLIGSFLLAPPLFLFFWFSLTLLMKHTEEKWLAKLYGKTYLDYCKKVNRCLPWFPKKAT